MVGTLTDNTGPADQRRILQLECRLQYTYQRGV